MKGIAIYKLERVGSAVDKLDAAVARLEQALAAKGPAIPDGEAGAEITVLRQRLEETEARNDNLKKNSDVVAEKLDDVICRVEALVKGA